LAAKVSPLSQTHRAECPAAGVPHAGLPVIIRECRGSNRSWRRRRACVPAAENPQRQTPRHY